MQMQIESSPDAISSIVRLSEKVGIDDARLLYERLRELSRHRPTQRVVVDFAQVEEIGSAGVVAVNVGGNLIQSAGKRFEITNLAEHHHAAFRMIPEERGRQASRRPSPRPLEALGELGLQTGQAFVELAEMVADSWRSAASCWIGRERMQRGAVVDQAVLLGINALPVVALLALLTGIVLSFQSAYQLQRFGAEIYISEIVGLGMVREFGPLMTGIILAGRSGASMTAELGTMAVREEIDALRTMGISPVRFLVLPRVLAMTGVQPVLTLMAIAIGMGGGIATAGVVGVPSRLIGIRMVDALTLGDFGLGLLKSILFAWLIAYLACFIGLRSRSGAHSVGQQTTRSVVTIILAIVTTDALVTTIWTVLNV